MMSHPDNLHLLAATLCTLVWVRMPGVIAALKVEQARS